WAGSCGCAAHWRIQTACGRRRRSFRRLLSRPGAYITLPIITPPRPDLLPALRNAALFGQIRRERREQKAKQPKLVETYEGVGMLSIGGLPRPYPGTVTGTLGPANMVGHCNAMVVGRIVRAPPVRTGGHASKDPVMTISVSAGFPARSGPACFVAAILIFLMSAPLYAQDKDPLVAKVNGVEVHQSDLAVAEEEAGQIPPMSPEAKQDYLVQFVADMILVSQAAQDKKFGDTADFKRKLEFARKKLLMEGLLQSIGQQALTNEAMHQVYDE